MKEFERPEMEYVTFNTNVVVCSGCGDDCGDVGSCPGNCNTVCADKCKKVY